MKFARSRVAGCLSLLSLSIGVLATEACATSDSVANGDAIKEKGTVAVQILAFNDFHGNLLPPAGSSGIVLARPDDPVLAALGDAGAPSADGGPREISTGGAAYLAAHIDRMRAENANTVVVSAGDLTGASPLLSNLFKDEATVRVMNAIGLDYEGVGNHDFDRGLTELLRLQKGGCALGDCASGKTFEGAGYKYLAANVDENVSKQTIFPPYDIKTFGGAKVAFIGMTLEETPAVLTREAAQGLIFRDEIETVNALIPAIKKEGADAIVVLLHQGGTQAPRSTYDDCQSLTGDILPILQGAGGQPGLDPAVDVVVSGHTHQAYNCVVDGRIVTSAASFGRVVTKIDLEIDTRTKKVIAKRAKNVPVTKNVAPNTTVASLIATYETEAAPLANRVTGYIASDLKKQVMGVTSCETPLGDVIADAQLLATRSSGAVIAFMNPGGIRTDLIAAAPGKTTGVVTYAEAFAAQPFANILTTVTLTGAQVLQVLQQQFVNSTPRILQISSSLVYAYTYDAATNRGTIDTASMRVNGAPLDLTADYRVTANAFVAGGGDGFQIFTLGRDRVSGAVDLDALVAYLGANSSASMPLVPPAPARITGNACN